MLKRAGPIRLTATQIEEMRRRFEKLDSLNAISEDRGIRDIRSPLTDQMLRPLSPSVMVVQTCKHLTDEEYRKLADFLSPYPNVLFRVYDQILDRPFEHVDFLRHFGHVHRVCIDSWLLKNFDGLWQLSQNLVELRLGETKFQKPLSRIAKHFSNLEVLNIAKQVDDLAAIGRFTRLRELFMLGCTFSDLEILCSLSHLEKLRLMGGVTREWTISSTSNCAGTRRSKIRTLWQSENCRNSSISIWFGFQRSRDCRIFRKLST